MYHVMNLSHLGKIKMIRKIDVFFVLVLVILLIVFCFVVPNDYQEVVLQQAEYCDMIAQYSESGGENGWPPFRGTAICK